MSHIPVNDELQLLRAEYRGATFVGVERQGLHQVKGGSLAQLIVVSTISTGHCLSIKTQDIKTNLIIRGKEGRNCRRIP